MSGQQIGGRLIAAARALAGVGRADFAAVAGLTPDSLRLIEGSGSAWLDTPHQVSAILRAFDHFGILIVEEAGGLGAGVRLKFTRQDVRQLVRLEDEGGIVGSDDAP